MNKIQNLESLLLEKQRLHYECRLKEEKLRHRLAQFGDHAPDLIKHIIPASKLNFSGILKTVAGILFSQKINGENPGGGSSIVAGTAEAVMVRTLFRIMTKILSGKSKKKQAKETTNP